MRVARVLAQAKINLFLKIDGRNHFGYHDLWTVFQRIDLADEIVVRVGGKERSLDASGPRMPPAGLGPPKKNLAYRAAIEYSAHTGWEFPKGFAIEITKNIPVGGGLGGGSADAGAVLRALDALAPKPMDPDELRQVAASLGADVPFLTSEHVRAMSIGRGDIISPLADLVPVPPAEVHLVVPPFAIATADAYRWLDEDRPMPWPPEPTGGRKIVELQAASSWWAGLCREGNDFEPVVEKRYPQLREIRERLQELGAIAHLSGSGSTVFGIYEGPAPDPRDLGADALVIPTRTSSRVVQVEVLE
ncbi:MAG: 4-(cytidine 5'-diphospho)-2-C-methyl-D-erythritol kinase [Gemmatimonadaceae bacterium]